MTYVPTGFPLGGPRKGEVRPYSPGAAAQQRHVQRMSKQQREEYKAVMAMYAQFKRLAFPVQSRSIQQRSRQREACWQSTPRVFSLKSFMREMTRCCRK